MSFMFKPLAYDDTQAVNHISLPEAIQNDVTEQIEEMAGRLAQAMEIREKEGKSLLALDGYVSAPFEPLVSAVKAELEKRGRQVNLVDMRNLYKTQEEIDGLTAESLPLNYEDDPVLLFGRLYRGRIDDFVDNSSVSRILNNQAMGFTILYGLGSLCAALRPYAQVAGYVDVTPKVAAIRAREQKVVNIGDRESRPFNLLMRRNYYVDYEVTVKLRKELL